MAKYKKYIVMAGIALGTMHVINKIENAIYTSKKLLNREDENLYEWKYGKLRYIKRGEGKPVILIHDLVPGSGLHEYDRIISSLSKKHTVYAIDLLGYGLSDKPYLTYSNFFFVQMIHSFIKDVIKEKVTVVASGESASIIANANLMYKDAFEKMVFINPQNIFDAEITPGLISKVKKVVYDLPIVGTFLYNLLVTKKSFEVIFERKYLYKPIRHENIVVAEYIESAHKGMGDGRHSFASRHAGYTNLPFEKALKSNKVPTLILAGKEYDKSVINIDNNTYLNKYAEGRTITNSKIYPQLENPGETSKAIIKFIE